MRDAYCVLRTLYSVMRDACAVASAGVRETQHGEAAIWRTLTHGRKETRTYRKTHKSVFFFADPPARAKAGCP
jgi:hypothetical protein